MTELDNQSLEPIRTHNAEALSAAIDSLLAQVQALKPTVKGKTVHADLSLMLKSGTEIPVTLDLDISVDDFEKVGIALHIDSPEDPTTLLLEFKGDFFIRPDTDYLENDAVYTVVKVDPKFNEIGIARTVVSLINEIRRSVFRKFHDRLGVDRYFVNAIDSSNEGKPGWTSKRLRELNYRQTDTTQFQQCFYIFRD